MKIDVPVHVPRVAVALQPPSQENFRSAVAEMLTSLKNTMVTFFAGSAEKKTHNITKTCAELLLKTTGSKGETTPPESLKLHQRFDSSTFSSRFTPETMTQSPERAFCLIKNELQQQKNKILSLTEGHQDKNVNIMLATLGKLYFETKDNPLKTEIENFCTQNFSIEAGGGNEPVIGYDNIIHTKNMLENMSAKYQEDMSRVESAVSARHNYQIQISEFRLSLLKDLYE